MQIPLREFFVEANPMNIDWKVRIGMEFNRFIFLLVIFRDQERKEVLLSKISNLLLKDTDDASICDWIVYLLGKVQYNFTSDESNSRIENSLFCLDLFIYCIVFTSGCAVFLTDGSSLKNRLQWLNKLPEALWLLAKRKHWTQHMPRVLN